MTGYNCITLHILRAKLKLTTPPFELFNHVNPHVQTYLKKIISSMNMKFNCTIISSVYCLLLNVSIYLPQYQNLEDCL